jgi:hypothetical protein
MVRDPSVLVVTEPALCGLPISTSVNFWADTLAQRAKVAVPRARPAKRRHLFVVVTLIMYLWGLVGWLLVSVGTV